MNINENAVQTRGGRQQQVSREYLKIFVSKVKLEYFVYL